MKRNADALGEAGSAVKKGAGAVSPPAAVCSSLPTPGTLVPASVRRAGHYLLGPRLGLSPVKSITHCLGRRDGTDNYYQLKVLSLVEGERGGKESQDERQGKMLLHTEHSLLSLLHGVKGVVQKHQTFMDTRPVH